ncbi:MAG: hypothetical protein ACYTXY_49460, partial [Nostoc sp.]
MATPAEGIARACSSKSWFSSSVMGVPANSDRLITPLESHVLFIYLGRIKTGILPKYMLGEKVLKFCGKSIVVCRGIWVCQDVG